MLGRTNGFRNRVKNRCPGGWGGLWPGTKCTLHVGVFSIRSTHWRDQLTNYLYKCISQIIIFPPYPMGLDLGVLGRVSAHFGLKKACSTMPFGPAGETGLKKRTIVNFTSENRFLIFVTPPGAHTLPQPGACSKNRFSVTFFSIFEKFSFFSFWGYFDMHITPKIDFRAPFWS